jgi:hypothetical protein
LRSARGVAACAAVRALSRRDLLKEGGAGAAALALAGGLPAAAAGAAPGGLTRRRRAVYRALVRALQADAEAGLRHRGAGAATTDFAAWYGRQEPSIRRHADAVLDRLDALGLGDAAPHRDLRALRRWSEAGDGAPSPEQAVVCATVAAARALAGAAA